MDNRLHYEKRLKSFLGDKISRIVYFDCEYEEEKGVFSTVDHPFHSLCFGVEFHTQTERILGLIWGSQFTQYGVDLFEQSIAGELHSPESKRWDVSTNESWVNVIGQTISNIEVYWSWSATDLTADQVHNPETIPESLRNHYPQDIVIEFNAGIVVYISASIYLAQRDVLFPGADEITIIFDKSTAQKYGIGPFAISETKSEAE